MNGVAHPATAVVSGWASWAVGAIGAKFYKSSNQPPPPSSSSNSPGLVTNAFTLDALFSGSEGVIEPSSQWGKVACGSA